MSRVVVTGGSGRLGRVVVDMLVSQGESVLSVDITKRDDCPCDSVLADITQAGEAYDVLRGCEAVVHLAAVPGPRMRTQSATFDINVSSTYNIAEAAVAHGLSRIVFGSTVFTLGWHAEADHYWPDYVPVDEAHRLTPLEGYGLSKVIGEEICATACRRANLTAISLRIMNVIQTDGYPALPWATPCPDDGVRFVMWPYVDVRDAARACCLALRADVQGHEAMYIAAADIRFDAPTETLLRQLAPQVEIRRPLSDRESVISIKKARTLIGYEPEHSWTSHRD
jgi:nucleoside-diphosphate-sugar epimerase